MLLLEYGAKPDSPDSIGRFDTAFSFFSVIQLSRVESEKMLLYLYTLRPFLLYPLGMECSTNYYILLYLFYGELQNIYKFYNKLFLGHIIKSVSKIFDQACLL